MSESFEYTAISFAPVQGFIEKSRKLRDLYGASLILSYLSYRLVKVASEYYECEVISPGLITVQRGMPNRILLKGKFTRNDLTNELLTIWKAVLEECQVWIETKVPALDQYRWEKEWLSWAMYSWEIFWGHGHSPKAAMKDLETRKLRRDWTAINWTGESSSLTGTDAIAWPRLGQFDSNPGRQLTPEEKAELDDFYQRLSYALDTLPPGGQPIKQVPADAEWEGKFLASNERLSIPELVKRLVTREDIAQRLGMDQLQQICGNRGFTEIVRMPEEDMETGRWTGWFMGDGDRVGKKIQDIAETSGDEGIKKFSDAMRDWGTEFMQKFPADKGQVIYAGGDDFMGVIYAAKTKDPINPIEALEWLMQLPNEWKKHRQDITLSVGFVWAAPSVPQRDVLQHCREAEKRAKKLGRDRVTIRVVFNSGQYVQWTCPWDYLHILKQYKDREGKHWGQKPNWNHVYEDLAQLVGHHAIPSRVKEEKIDDRIAIALFDIYFNDKDHLTNNCQWIAGKDSPYELMNWIRDLINVGWQLCSNT